MLKWYYNSNGDWMLTSKLRVPMSYAIYKRDLERPDLVGQVIEEFCTGNPDDPEELSGDPLSVEKSYIIFRKSYGSNVVDEFRAYINVHLPMDDMRGLEVLGLLSDVVGPLQLGMLRAAAYVLSQLDIAELDVDHVDHPGKSVKQYYIDLINAGDPT